MIGETETVCVTFSCCSSGVASAEDYGDQCCAVWLC